MLPVFCRHSRSFWAIRGHVLADFFLKIKFKREQLSPLCWKFDRISVLVSVFDVMVRVATAKDHKGEVKSVVASLYLPSTHVNNEKGERLYNT